MTRPVKERHKGCATYEGDGETCSGIEGEFMCRYCPKVNQEYFVRTKKYTHQPRS